ncbi:type II secretion system protein [Acinetobacter sp. YH12239]|uniref:type II secretion system protein n=1 Tax=Acinetobacter sp. YH12239 TaxID=2601166 RepID=UPI0015D446D6|nr:type II secretion system protein [Acinetobacter sp. YH12239]
MKVQKFKSTNQRGFTLLESLVGLLIFSIIVFGSGLAISKMLNTQRYMNIDNIVINELQNRLQTITISNDSTDVCASFNNQPAVSKSFTLNGNTYYIYCNLNSENMSETSGVAGTKITWPVLAASTNESHAKTCAEGSIDGLDCYRVGR